MCGADKVLVAGPPNLSIFGGFKKFLAELTFFEKKML